MPYEFDGTLIDTAGYKIRKEMVCLTCTMVLPREEPITEANHLNHLVAAIDILIVKGLLA